MLRCTICRSHAHAGLMHLHGLSEPLCLSCTQKVMEKSKGQEKKEGRKRVCCKNSDIFTLAA